jgi:hypothetical protein
MAEIMRGRARKSLIDGGGLILIIGVAVVALCAMWLVFRGTPGPEPSTKSTTPQPSQVARAETQEAKPDSSLPASEPVHKRGDAPPATIPVPSTIVAAQPEPTSPRPPDDAVTFNGHSYKFFPEVLPWHRAKARCEEMGGHLAIIESRDENDFVADVAHRGISRLGPKDGLWLGATDEHKEGAWKWVDGSQLQATSAQSASVSSDRRAQDQPAYGQLPRLTASSALAVPSRPKQRAAQDFELAVEEARDNGGGLTTNGGLLQFFRQDRPRFVENMTCTHRHRIPDPHSTAAGNPE